MRGRSLEFGLFLAGDSQRPHFIHFGRTTYVSCKSLLGHAPIKMLSYNSIQVPLIASLGFFLLEKLLGINCMLRLITVGYNMHPVGHLISHILRISRCSKPRGCSGSYSRRKA
ncbi:hypothetical protein VNO77_42123 [Canavalia gladiata]|uniref:Uncharacterized protein n=1 Tax=Canavalia gladiata TaxID=3824 RepID=A0AAN9K3J1_CANGL